VSPHNSKTSIHADRGLRTALFGTGVSVSQLCCGPIDDAPRHPLGRTQLLGRWSFDLIGRIIAENSASLLSTLLSFGVDIFARWSAAR